MAERVENSRIPWVFFAMKTTSRTADVALLVIATFVVAATLFFLRSILIPFVLAAFLAILFRPVVDVIRRFGGPTWLGLIVVIMLSAGALWGVSLIVALGVDGVVDLAPIYSVKLQRLLDAAQLQLSTMPGGGELLDRIQHGITPEAGIGIATSWLGSVVSMLGDGVMMLLFLVFLVLGSEAFPSKLTAALRVADADSMMSVFTAVNDKVLRYLRVKSLFNVLNALVMFTVLTSFGVDFASVIALLTFFLTFLPNIGSFISTVLPGSIALLQFENLGLALLIVVVLIVLQNIVGNVLEPRAMGQSLDLSPVVVLFALVFWGWMWGIVGMILSVPITAILKVVLEQFPLTAPVAILMGNRAPAAALER